MRLVRLGALFGSIVLLVATPITMLNKRSELRSRQDDRVLAAALIATQSVAATIERGGAVVEVVEVVEVAAASPDDVSPDALTASFDGASACVITGSQELCSGSSLLVTDAFERAAHASDQAGGSAIAVADPSTESVMIVSSGAANATGPDTDASNVAMQLPAAHLVSAAAGESLHDLGAVAVVTVGDSDLAQPAGPEQFDGSRVVTTAIALSTHGGSVVVQTAVADDVGLFGENLGLYGALLGLGTVLIGLAGWTFAVERRALEQRATTDRLTGLVNRHEFERLAEAALLDAGHLGTGACVMLIDLNGFKQINDTLGHQFGDLVLQACAERLVRAVRDTDVVGRWGGDEFVILLREVDDGTAVRASAERIAGRLSATPVVGDVSMTGSIGAALFPRHGARLVELIRAADLAMYEAKTTGVSHRLADALTVGLASDAEPDAYTGPERRHHPSAVDRHLDRHLDVDGDVDVDRFV